MKPDNLDAAVGPNDGGAAFPHVEHRYDGSYWKDYPGMSLRDWFAGQALAGIGQWVFGQAAGLDWSDKGDICRRKAEWAYAQADAMLAARAEGDRHA